MQYVINSSATTDTRLNSVVSPTAAPETYGFNNDECFFASADPQGRKWWSIKFERNRGISNVTITAPKKTLDAERYEYLVKLLPAEAPESLLEVAAQDFTKLETCGTAVLTYEANNRDRVRDVQCEYGCIWGSGLLIEEVGASAIMPLCRISAEEKSQAECTREMPEVIIHHYKSTSHKIEDVVVEFWEAFDKGDWAESSENLWGYILYPPLRYILVSLDMFIRDMVKVSSKMMYCQNCFK